MTAPRLMICAAAFMLGPALAVAAPAYVSSTVNLRADASTSSEVLGKIPGGSLVDATNCSEWCEVEWQGKKGYAIATALDRSGRVPGRRAAASPGVYESDDYVPVGPTYYYAPPPYYYGYRPYYWGYRRSWGYYGHHHHWHH